jgi:hypothetical protein
MQGEQRAAPPGTTIVHSCHTGFHESLQRAGAGALANTAAVQRFCRDGDVALPRGTLDIQRVEDNPSAHSCQSHNPVTPVSLEWDVGKLSALGGGFG